MMNQGKKRRCLIKLKVKIAVSIRDIYFNTAYLKPITSIDNKQST